MCCHSKNWARSAICMLSLVVIWGAGGCGPVTYVHQVVVRAESSVAAAKTHEAAKHAPYEYYGAVAYLKEARARAGYGDFQVAVKYGEKSEKMAKKAVRLTKERLAEREDVGEEVPTLSVEEEGSGGGDSAPREVPEPPSREAELPR